MINWKKNELAEACRKTAEAVEKLSLTLKQFKNIKKFTHQSKYHK